MDNSLCVTHDTIISMGWGKIYYPLYFSFWIFWGRRVCRRFRDILNCRCRWARRSSRGACFRGLSHDASSVLIPISVITTSSRKWNGIIGAISWLKGSWLHTNLWESRRVEEEWSDTGSWDVYLPEKNIRVVHCRLFSLVRVMKTNAGCAAAVGAISALPSERIEMEIMKHSCRMNKSTKRNYI